eukprot:4674214-Prymnesium_polylepis.1
MATKVSSPRTAWTKAATFQRDGLRVDENSKGQTTLPLALRVGVQDGRGGSAASDENRNTERRLLRW